jgi:protein-S-isoprenylcysteine O-methyltransferase Ste14
VLFVLAGEAIVVGSPPLAAWLALFFAVNAAYFPLVEEPRLERRFGDDYRAYRRNVPRWIPRRTPWSPTP